jgi:sugar phosphate isomerase/epimerase
MALLFCTSTEIRKRSRKVKHSVFTVALEDLSYEELAPILVQEGYDGVEWRITPPGEDEHMKHLNLHNIEEQAEKVKTLCDRLDLEIPALASYETVDSIDRVKKLFKLASLLGTPLVRVWTRRYDQNPHFDVRFKDLVGDLRRVIPMAKDYGVRPVFELHMGSILPGPSDARRIVDNFSPDEVGLTLDPGNMVIEGLIDWSLAVQILGPYLAHVHVKNTGWVKQQDGTWKWEWMALQEGMVDWARVIACLKDVGYTGYLSQEDFFSFGGASSAQSATGSNHERIEYVRKTLRQNKKYLDSLI